MSNIRVDKNFTVIPTQNAITNETFADVIGNKTDGAAITADVVSVVGLLRYIVANLSTDTDVAALIGALNTVAKTGAVDDATTLMGYLKQVVTQLLATDTVADAILVDTGTTIPALIGTPVADVSTDIATMDALIDAIKLITDALPDAGALTSIAQEVTIGTPAGADIATDIANVSTLIGTPAADLISDINTLVGTPVDTDVVTDIANVYVDTQAIATDTGTTIPTLIGTPVADLATDIAGVQTDTTALIASQTAGIFQNATVTTVDAGVTPWTVAAHRLFTVTGVVEIQRIFANVTETVVEGAGADNTLSIGTTDDVDLMIGATAGDALVAGDLWANVAGSNLAKHALVANNESFLVSDTDIDINVLGTNSIADGTVVFYCTWRPVSVGATLVAAIWD